MWTAASLRVARRYTARPGIPAIALAAAAPWIGGWLWLAAAALAALTGAVLLFFRDPPRRPLPAPPGTVYAVTDGTVKAVRRDVTVPWLPGGPYTQVSVFLSLLDVHTARSPVAGRLESWTKLDGQCRAAMRQAAETENRRGQLTITPDGGGAVIGVLLAAGLIARRITQWARPGALTPGERLGIIHFGSRSVLYLPQDRYRLMVAAGDRLAAGRTPVALRQMKREALSGLIAELGRPCYRHPNLRPESDHPARAHVVADLPRVAAILQRVAAVLTL